MSCMATGSNAWCCSGPRAGDAHDEPDYDIAVFLTEFEDRWQEIDRIIAVVTDILD